MNAVAALPLLTHHTTAGDIPGGRAASAMDAWLDALPFPREQIVLGGWSQGGAMAYVLGLSARRPRPAALVPLGAFLPLREGWEPNLEPPLPPVAIGHGTNDELVPVGWARVAPRLLEAAGAEVAYRESPVGHEIDSAWLSETRVLIERVTSIRDSGRWGSLRRRDFPRTT